MFHSHKTIEAKVASNSLLAQSVDRPQHYRQRGCFNFLAEQTNELFVDKKVNHKKKKKKNAWIETMT